MLRTQVFCAETSSGTQYNKASVFAAGLLGMVNMSHMSPQSVPNISQVLAGSFLAAFTAGDQGLWLYSHFQVADQVSQGAPPESLHPCYSLL